MSPTGVSAIFLNGRLQISKRFNKWGTSTIRKQNIDLVLIYKVVYRARAFPTVPYMVIFDDRKWQINPKWPPSNINNIKLEKVSQESKISIKCSFIGKVIYHERSFLTVPHNPGCSKRK